MLAFINESAIYQEASIVKSSPNKAIFRCILQTADDLNQNHRIYPMGVLRNGMEECRGRINSRAAFGELDHPLGTGNDQFDAQRQTTVQLDRVSHILRDYEFKGNQLIGELETTSTPCGKILLGLINDKAGVGFSMRGLAELERQQDHSIVRDPLTIISHDAVSRPSHVASVINFNEMRFESNLLTEQSGLVCINGQCFLPDYFDKLVESKVIKFLARWV